MKLNKFFIFGIGILVIASLFFFLKPNTNGFAALDSFDGEVKYYKSLTCGCCTLHENYLKSKTNLDIKDFSLNDISSIKRQYGVPQELESCHTIIMGDYFVEGHIPVEAIEKLMEGKPDIKGIAMPGMPSGSPGMPGAKYGDFVIYAVNNDGSYEEFMRI